MNREEIEREELEKDFAKLTDEELSDWTLEWYFNIPDRFRHELKKIGRNEKKLSKTKR